MPTRNDRCTCEADGYTKLSTAQAVIDDLGLTVEAGVVDHDQRTERNGIIRYGTKSRVVGKWEEEK